MLAAAIVALLVAGGAAAAADEPGHWVSTVAKALSSCNDNPRPAGED